jgi:PEP-CTERM motif-containing protein
MMKRSIAAAARSAAARLTLGLALLASASTASAGIITYDVANLGGTSWRYDYQLTNDALPLPVDEFAIYFDVSLYRDLRDAAGPAGWDLLVAQPDPALPDDGFLDALALLQPLAPGATLGVFSITFEFLGAGAPGAQAFQFLDSSTFEVLDAGVTHLRAPSSVPEPSSLVLLLIALAALGLNASRAKGRACGCAL